MTADSDRPAVADADNWEDHWNAFGDPALGNPANAYRNRLILRFLGNPARGSTVVDIGSGQGQLALLLQARYPDVHVLGVEYSHEGVRRATEAAAAAKLGATFVCRDLLKQNTDPVLAAHRGSLAVCSEVLEHIDQPEVLLRNAADYLLPGCRLVVTVPGGPKSALDRHIGHRRHYRPETIRALLSSSGYEVERVYRAGFPFFDLYRLAVIARGQRLIDDLKVTNTSTPASGAQRIMTRFFDRTFHWNLPHSPFGWQIVAIARLTGESGQ
jgi:SAM-dependent methyltransferase